LTISLLQTLQLCKASKQYPILKSVVETDKSDIHVQVFCSEWPRRFLHSKFIPIIQNTQCLLQTLDIHNKNILHFVFYFRKINSTSRKYKAGKGEGGLRNV
jgi:hypothetical protein